MPPPPPRRFLYLSKTKNWWCGEGDGGEGDENVHLLTHAPARGVGKKNKHNFLFSAKLNCLESDVVFCALIENMTKTKHI